MSDNLLFWNAVCLEGTRLKTCFGPVTAYRQVGQGLGGKLACLNEIVQSMLTTKHGLLALMIDPIFMGVSHIELLSIEGN